MNAIGHLQRLFILYGPFLVLLLAPLAYLGVRSINQKSMKAMRRRH